MSNPNQQHQQQNQQRQPEPWKPGKNTFVLLQSDEGVAKRCQDWISENWIGCDDLNPGRVADFLDARDLQPHHEIVVLYEDREAPVMGEDGRPRKRKREIPARIGADAVPEEPAKVLCTKPIKCESMYVDRAKGRTGVSITQLPGRDGQPERDGLMAAITNACMGKAAYGGGTRLTVSCRKDAEKEDVIRVTAYG
jgi:hypothetical protein